MTVARIVAQLQGIGIDISKRQVMRILNDGQEAFLDEARDVLRSGLTNAPWVTVDDTGARHKATNPNCHQTRASVQCGTHSFISLIAYWLFVTLGRRLHALAPGLTARSALEKFAAVQMIDVHIPTSGGRELVLDQGSGDTTKAANRELIRPIPLPMRRIPTDIRTLRDFPCRQSDRLLD